MISLRFFVSYSSTDEFYARQVVGALEGVGAACWIASRDIPHGGAFNREIPQAIERCDVALFVLTKDSDASEEVQREMALSTQFKKHICPVNFDGCIPLNLNYWLATTQWLRFTDFDDYTSLANAILSRFGYTPSSSGLTQQQGRRLDLKITRFAPLFLGEKKNPGFFARMSRNDDLVEKLTSNLFSVGLTGSLEVKKFNDGFAVIILREEHAFDNVIEFLRCRREKHLHLLENSQNIIGDLERKPHSLFKRDFPGVSYVMSVHQLMNPREASDIDIYAMCEPSLVGVTDDPGQVPASDEEAKSSLSAIKPAKALASIATVQTKRCCFYISWANVVLADETEKSSEFMRLEGMRSQGRFDYAADLIHSRSGFRSL